MCRFAYYTNMRRGRKLSNTIATVVLLLCVFALSASLTGAQSGIVAILSVFSSLLIFIFVPLFTRQAAVPAVRRVHRGRSTRAPPLS